MGFFGPGLVPPTPARRGCGIVSTACAPTALTAVASVPAAATVNTLRREIGSMLSSLTFVIGIGSVGEDSHSLRRNRLCRHCRDCGGLAAIIARDGSGSEGSWITGDWELREHCAQTSWHPIGASP